MRYTFVRCTVLLTLLAVFTSVSSAHISEVDERINARLAISESTGIAQQAIRQLREAGPLGLKAMLTEFQKEITAATAAGATHDDPTWQRIAAAIDAVAAQKDAYASGLYWYTDIEQAKAAARDSGKPILSLRLLGRLDAELSCANSRFFRTVLYANADVSKLMREHFILHWESVRPVPVVTIDMGDGRKVCRTITGNSIHYVLDAEGRPIDGIPGLYGPAAFRRALEAAESMEREVSANDDNRQTLLAHLHSDFAMEIQSQWASDLKSIAEGNKPSKGQPNLGASAKTRQRVPAAIAAENAPTKYAAEIQVLKGLEVDELSRSTDAATWKRIAALHFADARLDVGSRALVLAKMPPAAAVAGRLAMTKRVVEDPLLRMVNRLEHSIAEDTARNEYTIHRQIHEWFKTADPQTLNVKALNERVYAELFMTPTSDPWLGLVPLDAYSAIEGGGLSSR